MIFMYLELSFRYQKFDFRHFKKTVAGMLTPLFQSLYILDLHIFFINLYISDPVFYNLYILDPIFHNLYILPPLF